MKWYRKIEFGSDFYLVPGIILGLFRYRKSIVRDRNIDFYKQLIFFDLYTELLIEKNDFRNVYNFLHKKIKNKKCKKVKGKSV